jgi:TRAP-type C4-dicarboxylate transport system permease large subunit
MESLILVPILSLAAVCLALLWLGRKERRGRIWQGAALGLSVPPVVLVVILGLGTPGNVAESLFQAAFWGSLLLSAPFAAVTTWIVALSRGAAASRGG